jgi:uroporphyrin-III C-methyltransferase
MRAATRGTVYLVGAGPGDPDLLTRRAACLIEQASCILHDDLVSAEVLQLAGPSSSMLNVGKRCGHKAITQEQINQLMIGLAVQGESVVRLKSGDPLLYGRAGEEIDALRRVGIPFEIIPGITAAFAAAATAGLSLTDRRGASRLVFASGHHCREGRRQNFAQTGNATVALYMPGKDYSSIRSDLLRDGWPADTPCVLVSCASWKSQVTHATSIANLCSVSPLPAPSILLIGPFLSAPELSQVTEEMDEVAH